MIDTIADRAAPGYLMRGTAGPLAAVLRALGEAPGDLTPAVADAALILAAEQLTAQAEACPVCADSEGDLCDRCTVRSDRAASFRLLAGDLPRPGAL